MKAELAAALALLVFAPTPFAALAQASDWTALETAARSELAHGDLDKAESDFKSAIGLADSVGATEPGVVNCLCGLALVYHKRGNFPESERLYELAMRDMEGLAGPSSVRYADWMPDLAWLYNEHGKPDKAEVLFKNALQIRKRTLGDADPSVASLLVQYAKFLRANHRETEALVLESRAKSIYQKLQQ